jgi:hypothetical protein
MRVPRRNKQFLVHRMFDLSGKTRQEKPRHFGGASLGSLTNPEQ